LGDAVFISGSTTGDSAGPFSPLNEGFWVVLRRQLRTVWCASVPSGTVFQRPPRRYSSPLAQQRNAQAFSAAGVQVGDQVNQSVRHSARRADDLFGLAPSPPTWFEVVQPSRSAGPRPPFPTTAGIAFYSSAKRYLRIEADQQVVVQLNGATNARARR
jgi:hypothetical protein